MDFVKPHIQATAFPAYSWRKRSPRLAPYPLPARRREDRPGSGRGLPERSSLDESRIQGVVSCCVLLRKRPESPP